MTTSRETIQAALLAAKDMMDHPWRGRPGGGREHGSPFIAKEKKGAQKEEDILSPDFELFRHFYDLSGGIVRLVDIAPEQPGGYAFAEKASQLCTVSIAHTTADYDQAKAAFDKGVTHATHLFNAMSGLHHRKPGVVGAVFDDSRVRGELICDGFHIHLRCCGPPSGCWGTGRSSSATPCGPTACRKGSPLTWEADGYRHEGKATLAARHPGRVCFQPASGSKKPGFLRHPLCPSGEGCHADPRQAIGMEEEIGSIVPGKRADWLCWMSI